MVKLRNFFFIYIDVIVALIVLFDCLRPSIKNVITILKKQKTLRHD